jgi:hypothetical protein
MGAPVDWDVPAGRTDWLFGTGATRDERQLVWAIVLMGGFVAVATEVAAERMWTWWQWGLIVVLVVDVVGGVTANSLGTAKRLYSSSPGPAAPITTRIALSHGIFAAAHVHLFVVSALFPEAPWTWSTYWYSVSLVSVVAVRQAPVYLQRPLGLGLVAIALIGEGALVLPDPVVLGWLGPVMMLKLVVAHSVTESPFRPGGEEADD